jgi:phage shock protein A
MGFLSRLYNLWKGFLSIFIGRLEEKNPEIAYENAINNMTEKYATLKSAAAGLIKHRAKLEARIQKAENAKGELALQIEIAVEKGDDEVAVVLLEKEEELNAQLATDKADLQQAAKDADSAKDSLNGIKGEIDKLKREKDKVVAKIKDAEARKQIQEQLDGLSVDDEVKALENVREYAERVSAEVQIGDELKEDSLESKLDAIAAETTSYKARARLEALKAKRAAEKGETVSEAESESATPEKSL